MTNDPIATATVLVLTFAPLLVGVLLLSLGYGQRRKAQIAYLSWLASAGEGMPEQQGPTPQAIYPQQVVSTGRGLRVCGGILIGLGVVIVLGQLSAVANGL